MNACVSTTGLLQRLQYLLGVLAFSFFTLQQVAHAAPVVVVSVDHRVTVTYSKIQFDARKGIYSTQVRIKNRSATALYSPLRLSFDKPALKNIRLLNAHGVGKDGRPFFEFKLTKEMLSPKGVTNPVRVALAVEKGEAARKANPEKVLSILTSADMVSAGADSALLKPHAFPSDLPADSGKKTIRFSVPLFGKAKPSATVYLRRSGDKKSIAMNDLGRGGDLTAKDGIHGVVVQIDTAKVKPDSCLHYEAFTKQGRAELVSSPLRLCVSSFPVRLAEPDTSNPARFPDGSMAVADEILLTVMPKITAAEIRQLARSINAKVVGSYLSLNLYQLRLSSPVNVNQLSEMVARLRARPGVVGASINAIGQLAMHVDDTAFNLPPADIYSQHGLKLVLAHDQATEANAWDANANGSGQTVIVLDSGLDRTHPDFGTVGDCQLVNNDCGSASTDGVGHGTQVAGVVGAKTNNATGVAGIAYGSKIYPIQVSASTNVAASQMLTGFQAARDYVAIHPEASVINASFFAAGASATAAEWTAVCGAMEQVVFNGISRAVVVNAVGNNNINGVVYPARCNDLNAALVHKNLLITVSNSTSTADAAAGCGGVAIDQRCSTSNYGAWVDIAAPGSAIRTTTLVSGGSYASSTGNSFSAPFVAGAAAILRSCNMPPEQIESTLTTSANVLVPYPAFGGNPAGSTPRLNIRRALSYQAPTGLSSSNDSINENNAAGATVATLTATDFDPCDRFTFALVAGTGDADNGAFTITGDLLTINGVADFESKANYNIRVQVTDFGGATFEQQLTVNVVNVNEAPAGTNSTVSTNEDATRTFSAADFGFTDPADLPSNSLSAVIVTTLPGAGLLELSGMPVMAGQSIAAANIGNLAFTPAPNADGTAYASFTFQVVDDGGTANGGIDTDPTPNTLTIDVMPINDPPETAAGSGSGAEDASLISVSLSGSDIDGTVTAFRIASLPANGMLYSDAGLITPITAGGSVVATANAATVYFVPALNFSGSTNFNYAAVDNLGLEDATPAIASVAVTPVNDPPTILGQPVTFTHIEYNQANMMSPPFVDDVGTVSANDPEGDALTFSITAGNELVVNGVLQPDAFRFDAANPGKLVVNNRLALNYEFLPPADPSFNLTVAVTDGVNPPVTAIVKITLTNDAFDNGDPHVTTVDGLHYDFQSAGEFVALRGTNGMEIQVRQTAVSTATPLTDPNSGLTSGVSVNTALAARVGSHRVTYQPDIGGAATGAPVLRVDGALTVLPPEGLDLGSGGRVSPVSGNGIQIDFPDQTTLIASSSLWSPYNVWWLNISVFHTPAHEGIMGARGAGSWLPRLSNGSLLGPMPAALHDRYVDLYVKFADSWRVTNQTGLFDYAEATSTATFTDKAWPKEKGPYVASPGPVAKPLGRKAALLACRDVAGKNEKADCVFDVMVMGHANIAKGHLLTQKLRLGATDVLVRGTDKVDARGRMVFAATVKRHAAIAPQKRGVRMVPAGTVQFMLGGKPLGAPVRLDARGQAKLKVSLLKIGKQTVTARYLPAKGSAFLPSISKQAARALKPVGMRVPGNR